MGELSLRVLLWHCIWHWSYDKCWRTENNDNKMADTLRTFSSSITVLFGREKRKVQNPLISYFLLLSASITWLVKEVAGHFPIFGNVFYIIVNMWEGARVNNKLEKNMFIVVLMYVGIPYLFYTWILFWLLLIVGFLRLLLSCRFRFICVQILWKQIHSIRKCDFDRCILI